MSRKPERHRMTLRKHNWRGLGRLWWLVCTCGYFQGNHHKQDGERQRDAHAKGPDANTPQDDH